MASWATLAVVGCAASVTFLEGDAISRVAALVALLAGCALACLLAWREHRTAEARHRAEQLGAAMRYREQLHSERARQRAVVQALGERISALRGQVAEADGRATALQQQLSTLRGNYEALRVDLELQAALNAPATVLELAAAEPPDPWVTARELWRISDQSATKRPA